MSSRNAPFKNCGFPDAESFKLRKGGNWKKLKIFMKSNQNTTNLGENRTVQNTIKSILESSDYSSTDIKTINLCVIALLPPLLLAIICTNYFQRMLTILYAAKISIL